MFWNWLALVCTLLDSCAPNFAYRHKFGSSVGVEFAGTITVNNSDATSNQIEANEGAMLHDLSNSQMTVINQSMPPPMQHWAKLRNIVRGGKVASAMKAVSQWKNFEQEIRSLYNAGIKEEEKKEVPFHNLEHANNIWQFATWYAEKMKFSTEDAHILKISAISHDVMHPGTLCNGNNRKAVEEEFLLRVQRHFGVSVTLEEFAADVWTALKDFVTVEQFQLAFGDFKGATTDVKLLMVDRAPQEVLHAWVTKKLMEKHVDNLNPKDKAKVLMNILMTSITLQFLLRKAGTQSDHVQGMCAVPFFQQFQCGLLLHLLDMGWITQRRCEKDGACTTPDSSWVFAPRFLVESGFYKTNSLHDLIEGPFGENNFINMVIELVNHLGTAAPQIMDREMKEQLVWGAMQHQKIVAKNKFASEITKLVKEYEFDLATWMQEPLN